jgi:hypothetical protein
MRAQGDRDLYGLERPGPEVNGQFPQSSQCEEIRDPVFKN